MENNVGKKFEKYVNWNWKWVRDKVVKIERWCGANIILM